MTTREKYGIFSAYGAGFDQPEYSGERKNYIICYAPRTGSWLLCDLLRASGVMGVPAEYFNMVQGARQMAQRLGLTTTEAIPFHEYVKALIQHRTTPNGVFGVKIEVKQLNPLIRARAIPEYFPDAKYIYLSRKDRIAQGVSFEIAHQTRQWHASSTSQDAVFDETKLMNSIGVVTGIADAWEEYFSANNIEPYRTDYESLTADPHPICMEICRLVGVETDHVFRIADADFKKQSNAVNEDWIRRMKELPKD